MWISIYSPLKRKPQGWIDPGPSPPLVFIAALSPQNIAKQLEDKKYSLKGEKC